MPATAAVNASFKPIGNESSFQLGGEFPLAASSQAGRGQHVTAAPATGYASLNDGATPNQIGIGIANPSVLSDQSSVAGHALLRVFQGESHGMAMSSAANDGFTAADVGAPYFIADENTIGKLSNRLGNNRSLGGLVLGLFQGLPSLASGVVAWLIARATLITDAKLGAWHTLADAAANTTTAETAIHREKLHGVVTAVQFTGAAVAADNTDYVTITVAKRDGAGGGATTIATYDSRAANQGAVTAFVPASFSLSAVAGALNLLETDVVTITVDKGGSGKTLTGSVRLIQKVI